MLSHLFIAVLWSPERADLLALVGDVYFFVDHLCYFFLACVMISCASDYICLAVTCWESADCLALVCEV